MKKLTYLLLCLVLGIGLATAQTRKVTGTVISAEDSEPIIGASVIVKGTTTGTVTDFDGAFSLDVPSSAKTLVISYVGMIAREVPVQDVLRVVLQSGTQNLEEVVVTAIGMKKQEKALGYAASTVKSEDLNAAKSGSVMSGLTGKVAGLNITSGGATGSSQKVIVRGISSFSANQPLYVVDGVPIMNDFQGEDSFSNSVDFGNQANDINPEDVESVTVLKGASATALYGSRAANGVIMVTTKRAGAEKLSVTYDGSFMGSSVLRVPQTQDRFGQGWGSFGPMENGSWGPVLDGRDHIWGPYSDGSEGLLTPLSKPFSYVKNNLRDFYETGFETNNNVSIRMGNDKLGFVAFFTYDGSFMGSSVLRVPQTQDRFGQGWGSFGPMENGSWGPVLDGRDHIWGPYSDGSEGLLTPLSKPFSYVKNNLRDFYETGFETNNNVSIRMGNDKLGFVASYGNVKSDGVLPGDADSYARNTISLRGNMKYKRFSAELNLNYVRKDITQAAAGQGDDGATMFSEILQHAVDVDISSMKDYTNPYFNTDNFYTAYAENPYWVLDHNRNKYQDDRVYGKIELAFEIMKGLKAVGRLGGDFTNATQKRWNEKVTFASGSWSELGGKKQQPGTYTERRDKVEQIDATAFLNADYKIGEDIALNGMIGWNLNQQTSSYLKSYLYGLEQPGWFNLANGVDKPMTTTYSDRRRLVGLFAQGEFGYKNFWFVNASIRNDWSSTLPQGNNSFFYGGVNTSLIITDMFEDLKSDYLNFLKVRAAWGQTGNDAPIYRTSSYFTPTQISLGFGDLYLPINNTLGLTEYNRLPSMDLRPEITTEWEFGLTTHLFNNRLDIDAAYYNKSTKDQIISASLAPESRYTSMTRNVGKIANQGVELAVNGIPVRTKDFEWGLGFTFSKNWSEVKELWDDVTEYKLTSSYQVDFVAEVGQPLGVFKVPALATTDDGKVIVDNNGMPTIDASKKEIVGTSTPNFLMGFNTHFTWKGITLSAVLDWRNGGEFYSYTSQLLTFAGNSTYTVFNNREPFVVPNSVKVVNGQYVENDIPIVHWGGASSAVNTYYNNASNYAQYRNWILPKDYLKLREITLSYSLPKAWLKQTPFSMVQVSLIGRNLFMWTPKKNNYVDPEGTNYGNDILSEIGEFGAAPTNRTFGGGIKVVL